MTRPTADILADLRAARDHHLQEAERLTKAIEALEGKAPVARPSYRYDNGWGYVIDTGHTFS